MREKVSAESKNHDQLNADLEYYQSPHNLEKEIRARFNYRKKDETMVVIVPEDQKETTAASSSPTSTQR